MNAVNMEVFAEVGKGLWAVPGRISPRHRSCSFIYLADATWYQLCLSSHTPTASGGCSILEVGQEGHPRVPQRNIHDVTDGPVGLIH